MTSRETWLTAAEWQTAAEKHRQTARHWTVPCRRRRASRQKHPVFDFLFTYYPFSLGRLEQWHPGFGTVIENVPDLPPPLRGKHYRVSDGGVSLDAATLTGKQADRIRRIHNLLALTQGRAGNFACHGMHEWAMVYSGADIRHRESAPLRLSQQETDRIVESLPVTCSHFDAYRFFSPGATGFNKLRPTLDTRELHEQPACLHANMDLYKWASKSMPWVGSELLWQTFLLALDARELDMRASPYDLEAYGYRPIKIETADGRAEYEHAQRGISRTARPLRKRLIDRLADVIRARADCLKNTLPSGQPAPCSGLDFANEGIHPQPTAVVTNHQHHNT